MFRLRYTRGNNRFYNKVDSGGRVGEGMLDKRDIKEVGTIPGTKKEFEGSLGADSARNRQTGNKKAFCGFVYRGLVNTKRQRNEGRGKENGRKCTF